MLQKKIQMNYLLLKQKGDMDKLSKSLLRKIDVFLLKAQISKAGRPDSDFFENCTRKASSWADNPEAFCNALWQGKGKRTKKSVEKAWPSRAGSTWQESQWRNERSGFSDSAFRTPKEENWRVKAKKKKGK